jgi:sugar phosphate permease
MTSPSRTSPDLGERTRRRVIVHLIPYLFFLYILAYLDRVNVSVADLRMEKPPTEGGLGFTSQVVGFGAGLFFWGYWILEIPSTLSVLRWGARWVFVRILILWGLACILIGMIGTPFAEGMFGWLNSGFMDGAFAGVRWLARHIFGQDAGPVDDPIVRQFYFLRFMLGFFEGGFFPSVILYLTLWFRPQDRAKAIATFMAAIPFSNVIGYLLSAFLLDAHWFGLPGWRWVFLLQGAAPVLAGFATLFFLPDRPQKAAWLPAEERDWLVGELHREQQARAGGPHWAWLGQAGTVLLLTTYYFCINVTSYGLGIFMPSIMKQQLGLSDTWSSIVAALPYLTALVAMLMNGWHSDRTRERIAHVALPQLVLGLSLFLAALLDGVGVWQVLIFIFLVGPCLYAHLPAFWPLPSIFLGVTAAASAIGFINMIGNLGGFVGPAMVGRLALPQPDTAVAAAGGMPLAVAVAKPNFAAALFRLAPFPLIACAIILFVGWTRRKALAAARS